MGSRLLIIFMILCFLCSYATADEYVLLSHTTPGVPSQYSSPICYMPDGTDIIPLITIDENVTPDENEMIPIKLKTLPDTEEIEILVSRADIVNKREYKGIYDLPKAKVRKRMTMYYSMSEKNREAAVLIPGDWITVEAHIGHYYLISFDDKRGFISDNAVETGFVSGFISNDAYRWYDSYMGYREFDFVEGMPDGSENISAQQAIELAFQALTKEYHETEEHLRSLEVSVYINLSHQYGRWGKTWLISFLGPLDDYYPLTQSENSRDDTDEPEGIGASVPRNDDVHLFYSLEVSTETGEILKIHLGDLG